MLFHLSSDKLTAHSTQVGNQGEIGLFIDRVRQLMFDEFFFLTTGLPLYYPGLESKAKRKTSKKRQQKQLKEKKSLQAELNTFWLRDGPLTCLEHESFESSNP
jgi:hypothetical protein